MEEQDEVSFYCLHTNKIDISHEAERKQERLIKKIFKRKKKNRKDQNI